MPETSLEDGGGAPRKGPLDGIIVVDLTRVLAGPYCTLLLSDLGARVIKIERPGSGDDARAIGPFIAGRSAYFASINRAKQSIALDLKAGADRAIFLRLLAHCDVLTENYRPGAMERMSLGWSDLKDRFPRLIYAAVSGFGQSGPYAARPAYDLVVQAMGGLMSLTGHPGGAPTRVGTSIGDLAAGLFTALGIVAALLDRQRTGRGQLVDVAMLDCQVALLENAIARYTATGQVPGPLGSRHPSITPFEAFACADGHLVVAAGNNDLFGALLDALALSGLKGDPRFATNAARSDNAAALKTLIETAMQGRSVSDWEARLSAAGIPCGPINTIDKVLADPQVRARNMVVTAEDTSMGRLNLAGNPIKLSAFRDPPTRAAAPPLDGDRAAILSWLEDRERGNP